jgi:uncharacterized protein
MILSTMAGLAMVTGASSGIGEAYAERLAADGWDLVLVARGRERLDELAGRLHASDSVEARVLQADLGNAEDVQHVRREIEAAELDLLVNNAGIAHYMPFAELPPERRES